MALLTAHISELVRQKAKLTYLGGEADVGEEDVGSVADSEDSSEDGGSCSRGSSCSCAPSRWLKCG